MTLSTILSISLFASSASDLATTRYALHRGGHETNGIAGSNPYRQGAVSMSGATGAFLATRAVEREHSRLTAALKIGYIASRVLVSVNNVKVGRR